MMLNGRPFFKVWDMSVDSRRPLYTIRTMAAVARIQWRPDHENEITSCSLISDSRMYIWDIRRPHIAKYAFNEHDSSTTGNIICETCLMYVAYLPLYLQDSSGMTPMYFIHPPRTKRLYDRQCNMRMNQQIYYVAMVWDGIFKVISRLLWIRVQEISSWMRGEFVFWSRHEVVERVLNGTFSVLFLDPLSASPKNGRSLQRCQ